MPWINRKYGKNHWKYGINHCSYFRSLLENSEEEEPLDSDVKLTLNVPQNSTDFSKKMDFSRMEAKSPGRNAIK